MRNLRFLLLIIVTSFFLSSGIAVCADAAAKNPVTSGGVTTWNCVYFGHYRQTYSGSLPTDLETSYKFEQVKWRVLNVSNNRALLMADQIIDAAMFSKKSTSGDTYEEAPIFSYLTTMADRMFTSKEKTALCTKDQDSRVSVPGLLMLPSEAIMTTTKYGFTSDQKETKTRAVETTDYVKMYIGYGKKSSDYWTSDEHSHTVTTVDSKGEIYTYYNRDNRFGIRPIVVLDLSKNVWYDAGTINSNGVVTKPKTTSPVKVSGVYTYGGQKYKVITLAKNGSKGKVALKNAKNAKKVVIPASVKLADGKTYLVTKIMKNAFRKSKAKKVIIKTKKLTKASTKGSLKGSKVKTIQVKVGKKTQNKKYVKKYKKIFTKKNAGRKVSVK